jgi:formylglycine-generating enzyme required for sulfatase activity
MPTITIIDNKPIVSFLGEGVHPGVLRILGGTFRMGSNRHSSEEQLVHRVVAQGFWTRLRSVTANPSLRAGY